MHFTKIILLVFALEHICDLGDAAPKRDLICHDLHQHSDVGFIMDVSESVKNHWADQKRFVMDLVRTFDLFPNGAHAAVTTFSNTASLVIKFSDYTTTDDFEVALENLRSPSGGTEIGIALNVALKEMFREINGMRLGSPKVAVLITDGDSNSGVDYARIRNLFQRAHTKLLVVGIGNVNENDLQLLVETPEDLLLVADFAALDVTDFVEHTTFCEPDTSDYYTCGVKPLSISKKIVNGVEAEPYSIPWQVRLTHGCGGTLISPRHVLTAAHCPVADSDVIVGDHSIEDASDGRVYKKCHYKDHPKYKYNDGYDFSIIHLKEPVDIGPRAVPACLPTAKHSGDFLVGKNLTVSGWGQFEYEDYASPDELHVVTVKGISNAQCKEMYSKTFLGHLINSENLCAGDIIDGGEDSCSGDSGGPLTYNDNGHATLVGVVSWGKDCADRRYPGVYARVTDVLPWIQEELAKTC